MRAVRMLAVAASVLVLGACYHATISTGLVPSKQVVKESWAPGWIAGLIPPPVVETASRCPNGVAQVETQHSFLNMLVTGLTASIFTPMTIQVQCATGRRRASLEEAPTVHVPQGATAAQREQAVRQAVDQSEATGAPVYLQFE